jgi:hypothetical protein
MQALTILDVEQEVYDMQEGEGAKKIQEFSPTVCQPPLVPWVLASGYNRSRRQEEHIAPLS